MICPHCDTEALKVIDSRPVYRGAIRRRRECLACGKRTTTVEVVVLGTQRLTERDDRNQKYTRNMYTYVVTSGDKRLHLVVCPPENVDRPK